MTSSQLLTILDFIDMKKDIKINSWLTDNLKDEVRKVFEPRYNRVLTDNEIYLIAENLTGVMELFFKLKWREKYGQ